MKWASDVVDKVALMQVGFFGGPSLGNFVGILCWRLSLVAFYMIFVEFNVSSQCFWQIWFPEFLTNVFFSSFFFQVFFLKFFFSSFFLNSLCLWFSQHYFVENFKKKSISIFTELTQTWKIAPNWKMHLTYLLNFFRMKHWFATELVEELFWSDDVMSGSGISVLKFFI